MNTIDAIQKVFEESPRLLKDSSKRLAARFGVTEEEVSLARKLLKVDHTSHRVPVATATMLAQQGLVHPSSVKLKSAWMDMKGELKYSYTFDPDSDLAESILEAVSRIPALKVKTPKYVKPKGKEVALVEITLADIHFGRGDTDVLTASLLDRISETISDALSIYAVERIILYSAGDLFNSDGITQKTTKGTLQRNTSSYEEDLPKIIAFFRDAVLHCHSIAPVTVVIQPGNHSISSEIALGYTIDALFSQTAGVEVLHGSKRKVYQYGKVGIMFDHGELKTNVYNEVFAMEFPTIWGETKFREAHLGHWHQEKCVTQKGFKVRYLPSPAEHSEDEWIYQNAYYSLPEMQSFVWSKETGLRQIIIK